MGEEERFSGVLGTGGMSHQHHGHGNNHRGGIIGNGSSSNNSALSYTTPRRAPAYVQPGSGSGGMGGHFSNAGGSSFGGGSGGSGSGGSGTGKIPAGPGVYVPPALRAAGRGAISPNTIQVWAVGMITPLYPC